jgi:hypothetical protein
VHDEKESGNVHRKLPVQSLSNIFLFILFRLFLRVVALNQGNERNHHSAKAANERILALAE